MAFRKSARPFGQRTFARWRAALFAKGPTPPRVLVVRRYTAPWLLAFGGLAAALLVGAAWAPTGHELRCGRPGESCTLTTRRFAGAWTRPVTTVSRHERVVGDEDDPGPRLLVQIDGEGPHWFKDPRSEAGPISSLSFPEGALLLSLGGSGLGCLLGLILMALVRTRLEAHDDEGRLVVVHRSILGAERVELPLRPAMETQSVEDSTWERLVLRGGGAEAQILAAPRVLAKVRAFLRHAPKKAKRAT